MHTVTALAYLFSALCFIYALKGLSSPSTARKGNLVGMIGMAIAILTTFASPNVHDTGGTFIAIVLGGMAGTIIAQMIQMTAMPQLVAGFHSLVGMAAVLIAGAALHKPEAYGIIDATGNIKTASLIEMGLGAVIGAITFSGSVVAFGKLQGVISSKPIRFNGQHLVNIGIAVAMLLLLVVFVVTGYKGIFWLLLLPLAFALGYLLIIPIGGADMPVVISMLNSYSGWAASGIGFTLSNNLLIITGALVGASGAILSYIMCKAMNRSFFNVIFGGYANKAATEAVSNSESVEEKAVKSGSAEDAAFLLNNASSVIIVPGYGLAVARAQHALREMADILKERGIKVRYAIHPVAGRMPGHMNVLLAEASVPYDEVHELDEINNDFAETEVAFVIGANDVTNPAAKTDPTSPIYGMPVLDVAAAQQVLFVKRSMASGYAGVENELFYKDNTMMLFDDAKKMTEEIVKSLKNL
jgi:H+-translocating NAD(P) transhydrogenase subunit beta